MGINSIAEKFGVSPAIHEEDFLLKFLEEHLPTQEIAYEHYFTNGLESAERIKEIIMKNIPPHGICTLDPNSFSLLDFASGFGMVNRHFQNVLPIAKVDACDIHPKSIEFHQKEIGISCYPSSDKPEGLDIQNTYDVVIAISFFSHMPSKSWLPWLLKLMNLVQEGGLLIFTCHGPSSNLSATHNLINKGIEFFFYPESEQKDLDAALYGTSCAHPNFVMDTISQMPNAHLTEYKQGAWWGGTQDFYALTKITAREEVITRANRQAKADLNTNRWIRFKK